MKIKFLLLFVLFTTFTSMGQCTWKSFFPFEIGNSTRTISEILKTNSNITEFNGDDKLVKQKTGEEYRAYVYLSNDILTNILNLQFQNNACIKGNQNHIELMLSEDSLYRAKITMVFDDYKTMDRQYKLLLDIVPKSYVFTRSFKITNKDTNEKKGEGYSFHESEDPDPIKPNYIDVGYETIYKTSDNKDIEGYKLEINIVDVRRTQLTKEGY